MVTSNLVVTSCSADDEYGNYAGEELETLAEGEMRMTCEGNNNSGIHEDYFPIEENCCAAWALANCLYDSNHQSDHNGKMERTSKYDCYQLIKDRCNGGNCANMTNSAIISIAGYFNLSLQVEDRIDNIPVGTMRATTLCNIIDSIPSVYNKIIQIQNHTLLGVSATRCTRKFKDKVTGEKISYQDYNINCRDHTTNSQTGTLTYNSDDIICVIH